MCENVVILLSVYIPQALFEKTLPLFVFFKFIFFFFFSIKFSLQMRYLIVRCHYQFRTLAQNLDTNSKTGYQKSIVEDLE
jgi:hypothetical protein